MKTSGKNDNEASDANASTDLAPGLRPARFSQGCSGDSASANRRTYPLAAEENSSCA